MKVKIKYKEVVNFTRKAWLIDFWQSGKVWLPISMVEFKNKRVIIPEWLAVKNNLHFKPLYNKPTKIEPVKNQEAIDELIDTTE